MHTFKDMSISTKAKTMDMAVVKWHDKEYGTTNFFLHKYSYTGLRVAAVWLPHIDKLFLLGAVEQKPLPPLSFQCGEQSIFKNETSSASYPLQGCSYSQWAQALSSGQGPRHHPLCWNQALTFHTQSLLNLLPLEEREEMKSAPNNRNNRLNCPLYPVRIA